MKYQYEYVYERPKPRALRARGDEIVYDNKGPSLEPLLGWAWAISRYVVSGQ